MPTSAVICCSQTSTSERSASAGINFSGCPSPTDCCKAKAIDGKSSSLSRMQFLLGSQTRESTIFATALERLVCGQKLPFSPFSNIPNCVRKPSMAASQWVQISPSACCHGCQKAFPPPVEHPLRVGRRNGSVDRYHYELQIRVRMCSCQTTF